MWGHSSAGRALAWHARGRRFDPAWLHQFFTPSLVDFRPASPSSRGLGHIPFTDATGVRIPLGTPLNQGFTSTRPGSYEIHMKTRARILRCFHTHKEPIMSTEKTTENT